MKVATASSMVPSISVCPGGWHVYPGVEMLSSGKENCQQRARKRSYLASSCVRAFVGVARELTVMLRGSGASC